MKDQRDLNHQILNTQEEEEKDLHEQLKQNEEQIEIENENENENEENTDQEIDLSEEKDMKFQEGQIIKFVRVRFPGNAKSFPFLIGKRKFEYGKKVVAMSDRGMAVGYINSFPYEVPFEKTMLPLQSILKIATDQDIDKDSLNMTREKEAKTACKHFINKHQLDMELTHVEYTQFGKKAVFYFTSPARVDFRGLVKDLVTDLKMRIELRQIGFRDRTAALGGIGPCGLQLCCSSFLNKYGNVNLKMAKNQNLTMNPGRLNGVCGQLKCCIQYEDEVYKEKLNRLPLLGEFILTVNGDRGRVEKHHILIEQFEMITDQGQRRKYALNQYNAQLKLPANWQFPTEFEHISNETDQCIGLSVDETTKSTQFLKKIIGTHGFNHDEDDHQGEEEKAINPPAHQSPPPSNRNQNQSQNRGPNQNQHRRFNRFKDRKNKPSSDKPS